MATIYRFGEKFYPMETAVYGKYLTSAKLISDSSTPSTKRLAAWSVNPGDEIILDYTALGSVTVVATLPSGNLSTSRFYIAASSNLTAGTSIQSVVNPVAITGESKFRFTVPADCYYVVFGKGNGSGSNLNTASVSASKKGANGWNVANINKYSSSTLIPAITTLANARISSAKVLNGVTGPYLYYINKNNFINYQGGQLKISYPSSLALKFFTSIYNSTGSGKTAGGPLTPVSTETVDGVTTYTFNTPADNLYFYITYESGGNWISGQSGGTVIDLGLLNVEVSKKEWQIGDIYKRSSGAWS